MDSRWQNKINDLEDTSAEIIQSEEQREKRLKKSEQSLRDQLTIISGVPEREGQEKNFLNKIPAKNYQIRVF